MVGARNRKSFPHHLSSKALSEAKSTELAIYMSQHPPSLFFPVHLCWIFSFLQQKAT